MKSSLVLTKLFFLTHAFAFAVPHSFRLRTRRFLGPTQSMPSQGDLTERQPQSLEDNAAQSSAPREQPARKEQSIRENLLPRAQQSQPEVNLTLTLPLNPTIPPLLNATATVYSYGSTASCPATIGPESTDGELRDHQEPSLNQSFSNNGTGTGTCEVPVPVAIEEIDIEAHMNGDVEIVDIDFRPLHASIMITPTPTLYNADTVYTIYSVGLDSAYPVTTGTGTPFRSAIRTPLPAT